MSKRYREVLEEVETRASRTANPGGEDVAYEGGHDVEGTSTRRAAPAAHGGVATLVRPHRARTTPAPDPSSRSAARPGNGPAEADEPLVFHWRGRRYEVTRILGHWREEEGWWRRPDGEPIRIEQSDLWRVEAARNPDALMGPDGPRPTGYGVYELARRGITWHLDRVWD